MTERRVPKKAGDIVEALLAHHNDYRDRWVCFPELRIGTGYGSQVEGRIDFWAMDMWPSGGLTRYAYEIKMTRSDFLTELKNPQKRRKALLFSNLYYFIAPKGLIKPEEVPLEAGLREVEQVWVGAKETWSKWMIRTTVEAHRRDTVPPTWRFFAAIARRIAHEEKTANGSS